MVQFGRTVDRRAKGQRAIRQGQESLVGREFVRLDWDSVLLNRANRRRREKLTLFVEDPTNNNKRTLESLPISGSKGTMVDPWYIRRHRKHGGTMVFPKQAAWK